MPWWVWLVAWVVAACAGGLLLAVVAGRLRRVERRGREHLYDEDERR